MQTMELRQQRFTEVLKELLVYARDVLHIEVIDTTGLDPYFKGDLDGARIWISAALDDEEELFNTVHLIGHCVQWNVSNELRALGSVLHEKPGDELLHSLQKYEWEANCYGLYILHHLQVYDLDAWLSEKYRLDMLYLTHYYKTGEKLKEVTDISLSYPFTWSLVEKEVPPFTPHPNPETRRGIVIDFTNATKRGL
jgi:hypothetical protein